MSTPPAIVQVALDVPLPGLFDYLVPDDMTLAPGDWVVVPWGRGRRVGLAMARVAHSEVPAERLKAVDGRLSEMPRARADWLDLLQFAARYYHCPLGEIALPSVPKSLRTPPAPRARGSAASRARSRFELGDGIAPQASERVLTVEQSSILKELTTLDGPVVPVSYTHPTLPTNREGESYVVTH